jgi:rsbT co-antagonist protein RsbR
MWLGRLRITTQLMVLVISSSLVMLSIVIGILLARAQTIVEDAIIARHVQLLELTARQLALPARESDIVKAREVMAPIPQMGSISRVALYSVTGIYLNQVTANGVAVDSGQDDPLVRDAIRTDQIIRQRGPDEILLVAPIKDAGRPVGGLVMNLPTGDIQQQFTALRQTALLVGVVLVAVMAMVAWLIARYTARPIESLTRAAAAFARGELDWRVDVQRGGELGMLAQEFRRMAHDLLASRQAIESQNHMLEQRVAARTADLEQALDALRESISDREQLSTTIHAISSPVMPVLDGILVMPLIGTIDSSRAELIVRTLLDGVERYQADYVIIDVTGVPIFDAQVAGVLLDAARAAMLLGTRSILVGLRPELAQTIIGLGIDLAGLVTLPSLQSGVTYAMRSSRPLASA